MADNFTYKDAAGATRTGASKDLSGVDFPRVIPSHAGADVGTGNPLPVVLDDAATETTAAAILAKLLAAPATEAKQDEVIAALALLLTELGQKLEPGDLSALATAANQDTANTALAAILAKLIAAPSTEAKQDTLIGHVDGIETLLGDIRTAIQLLDDLTITLGRAQVDSAVTSVPADPFGANADAAVAAGAAGSIQAKLRRLSTDLDALLTAAQSLDASLPAAAALADNTANPTTTSVATFPHVYDGATWDRAPGDSTKGAKVQVVDAAGAQITSFGGAAVWADSVASADLLTTGLDSLADAARAISSAITPDGLPYGDLELAVRYTSSAPAAGISVAEVYLLPTVDGTNYPEGGTGVTPQAALMVGVFESRNGSTGAVERLVLRGIELPARSYKVVLVNKSGKTYHSSGNTLKVRTYAL